MAGTRLDAPGHDETGDAASNEKPRRVGRSRWSSEEARANCLRKTEYVLYLSHSRSLTFVFLQRAARREEEDRKIDFEAFRPQPETRVEAGENFFI